MQIHFRQTFTRFEWFLSYFPSIKKCVFRKKSVILGKKVWFLPFFCHFLSFFCHFLVFFGIFFSYFWLKGLNLGPVFLTSFGTFFWIFSIFLHFCDFVKKGLFFWGQFFSGFFKILWQFLVDSKRDSFGAPKSGVLHKATTLGRSPRLTKRRYKKYIHI